jgi:hypothetical protein
LRHPPLDFAIVSFRYLPARKASCMKNSAHQPGSHKRLSNDANPHLLAIRISTLNSRLNPFSNVFFVLFLTRKMRWVAWCPAASVFSIDSTMREMVAVSVTTTCLAKALDTLFALITIGVHHLQPAQRVLQPACKPGEKELRYSHGATLAQNHRSIAFHFAGRQYSSAIARSEHADKAGIGSGQSLN